MEVFQFESIRWGNPDLWWLLLLPAMLVPAWVWQELSFRKILGSFPGTRLVPSMVHGSGTGRRLATFLCAVVALELLGVAAMRPRYGLKDYAVKGIGVDIAIVLDASRSMKVSDVAPDRLGKSIIEISRLLRASGGNRVALVPFAGISFIQSPLTVDHEVIRQYLNDLRVTDIPVPGTALGRALNTAGRALGIDQAGFRGSAHKAIVVFTDGENHEGEPAEVARNLAQKGVRIFTVGVGTPEGKPIPRLNDKGVVTGLTRADDGVSPVLSKLDEALLKEVAEVTGGKYFQLSGLAAGASVSEQLMKEIDSLQKAEYMSAVERLLEDRFQYPLAAAIVFMLLPFLWAGVRRRPGPARVRAAGAAMMVAVLALSMPASAEPFEHPVLARLFNTSHGGVDDATELIQENRHSEALTLLKELATRIPPSPALDLDLALAAFGSGDFGAAVEYAEGAIRKNDALPEGSPIRLSPASLHHAKGTMLAARARAMSVEKKPPREVRKVYRQAVDSLVAALLLDPENPATRRNLEIVATAAYPPCSSLDDAREPNNTRADAAFLTPDPSTLEAAETLLLCPADTDWFKLPVNQGETLFVSVQKPPEAAAAPGGDPSAPAQQQKPEPADVDLSLEGDDGTLIADGVKQARWTAPDDAGSTMLMKVTGPQVEDGVDYFLSARIVPPCPFGDDQMEPNDSREATKAIQEGEMALRSCPLNDDWFQFVEQQGQAKEVRLTSSNSDDPVDLQVFSADGASMDVRTDIGPDGTVRSVLLPKAEQEAPFTILVSSGAGQAFYTLSIQDPEGGQNDRQNDDQQNNEPKPDEQEGKDRQQEQKSQGSRTMRELIDAIDSNDRNLEAQEAARNNPMGDSSPDKDW